MKSPWVLPGLVSGVTLVAAVTAFVLDAAHPPLQHAARLDPIILKNAPPIAVPGIRISILLTGSKYASCTDITAVWQWVSVEAESAPRPSVDTSSARHRQEISRVPVNNLDDGPFELTYDVPVIDVPFSGLWQIRLDVLYEGVCDVPVRRVEATYSPAILIHVDPSDAPQG